MDHRGTDGLEGRIVELIEAEGGTNREYYLAQISELERDERRSGRFFSSLLEIFVHLEFEEEEARRHWERILDHSRLLSDKLGSTVGVHMAIVDYFTNVNRLLNTPLLIEIHVFKQTERLAMVDGLTSVFNRRYMDMALKREHNRCRRYRKELSLIIVDIDNFKLLNDDRGHVFGDIVLKEFARFLRETLREEDVVCRYGGEEFLAILPETPAGGALHLAERLRLGLKDVAFFRENRISFSGGTATFPEAARSVEELVKAADKALYQAKFAGKDRIVQAPPERRHEYRWPRTWSLELRRMADASGKPCSSEPCKVLTQNLSLGGARFECADELRLDDQLSLVFRESPGDEGPLLSALGKVIWARRVGDGRTSYGVSFFDLAEEAAKQLELHLPLIDDIVPGMEESGDSEGA